MTKGSAAAAGDLVLASRAIGDGLRQTELSVPGIKCAGCIRKIEEGLSKAAGVDHARVNLATKRVIVDWRENDGAPPLIDALSDLGFEAYLCAGGPQGPDKEFRKLVRQLAVAGFGAANIMMLSVGVWAGADAEARALFHWLSALIALPVMAYSGSAFFSSAWAALRVGRTNMDVPISVGVAATFAMSAYDTMTGGPHAYFDAAASLLFFLLAGRTVDYAVRSRARSAIAGLKKLAPEGAEVVEADGSANRIALEAIKPGMLIRIPAGGRIPVNGTIVEGRSDIDDSVISGESAPRRAAATDTVLAGALNLTGPLVIRATSTAGESFVSEMIRLMEQAESARHGYQRFADRVSRLYTPVVHVGAVLAFVTWFSVAGDAHRALGVAVSVLIITCPCALGLAVPMVQAAAAQRLFRDGVLIKDGAALEKLSEVDTVVFDKTGTLTEGAPQIAAGGRFDDRTLRLAAALAAHSLHPYSKALTEAARGVQSPPLRADQVTEHPGDGIEAVIDGVIFRLGRPGWAAGDADEPEGDRHSVVVLGSNGAAVASFKLTDALRPSARETIEDLRTRGLSVEILSGDRVGAVAGLAGQLGGVPFSASLRPEDKLARISDLARRGRKVLMVGDGVNDAPALAAAHVSMAPASAADIGRSAADIVFLSNRLDSIVGTLAAARRARSLMRQNIAMAALYNAFAVPLAFLGHVTPLIAAIAMSSSSIIVVLNSLRVAGRRPRPAGKPATDHAVRRPQRLREATS